MSAGKVMLAQAGIQFRCRLRTRERKSKMAVRMKRQFLRDALVRIVDAITRELGD